MAMEAAIDSAVRNAMSHVDFTKKFKHPVKFDGTDFVETRLSEEEQFAQLRRLLNGTLHVFLERYGAMLEVKDLDALSKTSAAETVEAKFWLERLLRKPPSVAQRQKQARRRRWAWAKREMLEPSGFFSEDVMKHRDPKLFHELIGRHLQPTMRMSEPMKGNLSNYLMQRLDQECNPCLSKADSEQEDCEKQEGKEAETADCEASDSRRGDCAGTRQDDESLSEDQFASDAENEGEIDIAGRRAQFLKSMRDRFVNGKEANFDYDAIDGNSDLEDLIELGQDAEDRYFDAE
jgi:hypothetical protein